jgi:S1-C subfamily serine protease
MRPDHLTATTMSLVSVITLAMSFVTAQPASAQAPARWGNLQFIGPDTISDVASSVAPGVVNLVASMSVNRPGLARLQAQAKTRDDANKKIRRYYGIDAPPPSEAETLKVTGSGVIVSPDGYILTSLHVVENGGSVNVTLHDGREFQGNIVAKDRFSDLALLKIPAKDLQTVTFGNAESLRPGDWVIAIGNQFGLGHTVTHGLVSGLGREAKGFEKSFGARTGAVRFIQTDAPINPGSSGGPLLNLKGEVVGINTFIRDDAQNIGFAIPSNVARDVADKLTRGVAIPHPYIGITMKDQNVAPGGGVEVAEVKFRSPASTAGILPGDVIMIVDEKPASKPDDVSSAVSKHAIGDNLKLKIRRNGEDNVKIETLPEEGD